VTTRGSECLRKDEATQVALLAALDWQPAEIRRWESESALRRFEGGFQAGGADSGVSSPQRSRG
jgi:hypothetical protein